MKKIINGKKYDTATARLVGKWLYGNGKRDFYLQHEKLFCKKTGEYFLHAKGSSHCLCTAPTQDLIPGEVAKL